MDKRIVTGLGKAIGPAVFYCLMQEMAALAAGSFPLLRDTASRTGLAAAVSLPWLLHWFRQRGTDRHSRVQTAGKAKKLGFLAACIVCGMVFSLAGAYFLKLSGAEGVFSNETQEALFASSPIWLILGPGLIVPIAEEMTYRGLVYAGLKSWLGTAGSAAAVSGLFAILHGNPLQMLYAFPMALILQGALILGERILDCPILAPILLHMGANGISIWVQLQGWTLT